MNVKPKLINDEFQNSSVRFCILGFIIASVLSSCFGVKNLPQTSDENPVHSNLIITEDRPLLAHIWLDSTLKSTPEDIVFIDAVKAKILGKGEDAFKHFTTFSKMMPYNATAYYELSRLLLDKNDVRKALAESDKAIKIDSLNIWIQGHHANLLAYDGQYIKAAKMFGNIAERAPFPEEFLIKQAILYQKAELFKEALKVLDKLEKYTGSDDELLIMQREQLYLNQNDIEGAANEIRKLISLNPHEPEYAVMLGNMYESNNQTDSAEQSFLNAELNFPDDPSVQLALVQYYLKNNDTAKFNHYFEKAITNKSLSAEEQISLVVPLLETKYSDTLTKNNVTYFVRKMAEQKPTRIEPVLLYADMLTMDQQYDSAMTQYLKAVALDSSRLNVWQQILVIKATKLQADSLIYYGENALEIFPEEPMIHYFYGMGFQLNGDNDKAIEALLSSLQYQKTENKPFSSRILTQLADLYNLTKAYTLSDSCFEKAIEFEPENETALNNYSYYLSERNEKLDLAEKLSAQSLKLRPNEPTFLDTYGWIKFKQGKYTDAKKHIQLAIEILGEDADAVLYEHLGDIEFKLGNLDKALMNWEKANKKESSEELLFKIKERKLKE